MTPAGSGMAWAVVAAVAFGSAAVVAALVLGLLRRRTSDRWHDLPNDRSLHVAPVPRVGGLGIHAGWLSALCATTALGARPWADGWAAVALGAVLAVSLLDDRHTLGTLPRLAVQAGAAAALVGGAGLDALRATAGLPGAGSSGALSSGALWSAVGQSWPGDPVAWAALALLALAVLWAMNLYNFMDGADGLAGGMAIFGFGTYALAAGAAAPGVALTAAAVSGAAAGFLAFNFPPARVFMGDAGSVPLGFLAAALGLAGIAQGAWGWWLPPLAFLPFALDATFTLAQRALRGERVWQAHREHGYQKLILMGWSHWRCALAWYAAMAACTVAAVALEKMPTPVQWAGLAALTALALLLRVAIELAWGRRRTGSAP